MELVGVERDVVVFYKVAGQQTDEVDENFFHTLGCLAVYDGMLLGILQVKQKYGAGRRKTGYRGVPQNSGAADE